MNAATLDLVIDSSRAQAQVAELRALVERCPRLRASVLQMINAGDWVTFEEEGCTLRPLIREDFMQAVRDLAKEPS